MRGGWLVVLWLGLLGGGSGLRFTDHEMEGIRQRIKSMFYHAYNSYLDNAYPYDELRPLTCDGQDTWGSFSLTLIDALDTLLVLGNNTEFQRVATLLQDTVDFNMDVNASVFETNIRGRGGGREGGRPTSEWWGVCCPPTCCLGGPGWSQSLAGPAPALSSGWLLTSQGNYCLMSDANQRGVLAAFQTSSGMPYGTVNLLRGVSPTETAVTCTAGVGTFILEFSALSRLTGDQQFERAARHALQALWSTRSEIGLVGNHIDVQSRKWVAQDTGIGAGVDSYLEYLVKGSILLQDQELLNMFLEYDRAIQNYTRFDDWYLWVQMHKGTVTMPVFQSLEAFWPGLQSLVGDLDGAIRTFQNYYSVWRQFGGLPEFYSITQGYTVDKREGYPLRPELIESAMYLFRATGDHTYLQFGLDAIESIEKISKTPCGYASVKDVRDHKLDNRMESFFLAETIKYLYLLFDPAHFLHGAGEGGDWEVGGEGCVLGAGGYIFNTEAHPLDPGALHCCSHHARERQELQDILLSLSQPSQNTNSQSETPTQADSQSESIALKPGERKTTPPLSCPVQPFSARLAVLGQVFTDPT
ncbi:ER degradation-enhancing alpha-mannosidase-like protein 2 [Merluccius polli]|uniref:alpha-1,2-Mannosidase n=1 Tax=Merluccius polli TaxID=89951 RepID=A0AA47P4D0_MERPO|nr:ER degradation-enhancing alpha-mannosidase-like protein 2 [Merluccius polli]